MEGGRSSGDEEWKGSQGKSISLRKWRLSDLETLKEIRRRSSKTSSSHYNKEDVMIMKFAGEHFLLDMLNPNRQGYTLLLDNEIIGYFTISIKKKWLWHIFIDPKYFGMGMGKYALAQVEQIFKKNSLDEIHLYARLNAVGFYKKIGFEDRCMHYWYNPLTRFKKIKMRYMIKKLHP